MLPIKKIESSVAEKMRNAASAVHGFDHLKRTALGAVWFAKALGLDLKEQQIFYVAGLVHDFDRPLSEKEHKDINAAAADRFLRQFKIEDIIRRRIVGLVEQHRTFSKKPLADQCLFLSDKLLEQSGAYIIFRRCVYVGECLDFKEEDFYESMIFHWKERMNKFRPEKFHKNMSSLAHYQYGWQTRFFEALESGQEWAVSIAKECYDVGKTHRKTLLRTIEEMIPWQEGKEFKEEALLYVKGEKFGDFEKLIQ